MRCFYVLKKWSSAKLSLNWYLSLNKMSLNRDCTVNKSYLWLVMKSSWNLKNYGLHRVKLGLLYAILSIMTIYYSWFDKMQKLPNYPPNHSSNWSNWIFWEFSCQCAPASAYVSLYLPLTASLSLEQAAEKITAAMPSFTDLWWCI